MYQDTYCNFDILEIREKAPCPGEQGSESPLVSQSTQVGRIREICEPKVQSFRKLLIMNSGAKAIVKVIVLILYLQ